MIRSSWHQKLRLYCSSNWSKTRSITYCVTQVLRWALWICTWIREDDTFVGASSLCFRWNNPPFKAQGNLVFTVPFCQSAECVLPSSNLSSSSHSYECLCVHWISSKPCWWASHAVFRCIDQARYHGSWHRCERCARRHRCKVEEWVDWSCESWPSRH